MAMASRIGLRLVATIFGGVLLAVGAGAALPGGDQLVFASTRSGHINVYLMQISRGITLNLTPEWGNDGQPAWSPDGTQLAFVSNRDGNLNIYTMNVGCQGFFVPCTRSIRRLTDYPGADFSPAWSPDGTRIAFVSEVVGYEIFVIPAEGGQAQQLTDNDYVDVNPVWSPDGSQIAFSSDRDQRWETDLYVMNADGSSPRRLLDNTLNDSAWAWSPDGRLLFTTSDEWDRQLAILDVESGRYRLLLDAQGDDDAPAWSPDGQSIVLVSYRIGFNGELYRLPLDCAGVPEACLERLTFNESQELNPQFRP